MPTVPTLAKRVPKGKTAKLSPQVSSSVIQAAAKSSQAPAEAAVNFQRQRDESRAREAFNNFRAGSRDELIRLKSLRGSDAAGGVKSYQEWYEKESKIPLSELDNGIQQEMFNQLAEARKNHDTDSLSVHEATEHRRFMESGLQSTIITGRFDAASDPFNKGLLDSVLVDNRERFEEVRPGLDNSGDIARADADVISAVILAQTERDPMVASKTLETRRGALGGAYEKLKAKVDSALLNQQALQYTNVIVAKEVDYEAQIKAAHSIGRADLQDEVVTRINARHQERERVKKANNQAVQDGLTSGIIGAPTLESARDIAHQAPDGTMELKLLRVAESLHGQEVKTSNYQSIAEARAQIDRGEIANIQQLYADYSPFVKDSDMKALDNYLRQRGNKGDVKDTTVRRVYQQLTQEDPDKNDTQAKKYDSVWNFVLQNLKPGDIPTDEVVRSLVSTALVEGEREGGGFGYGEDIDYVEAREQGLGDSWLPDVDSDEEKRIIPILKSNNKSVTDKNIRLYKKHAIMGVPVTSK